MGIPDTVRHYLDKNQADFAIIHHPHTGSSMETAETAHIPGERIAKGVLLEDEQGCVLAVLPATHTLRIAQVRAETGRQLSLAPESRLPEVFPDCAPGAVPSIGPAYGVLTIIDDALRRQPELYFEAGDHEDLIRVTESCFEKLLGDSQNFRFSMHRL